MNDDSKAVLITGCSSGIGHETARHLAAKGWTVYATARRPETLADLAEAGCKTLACDVTDEASMRACVDAVVEAEGAVGVLVNNAGYSQSGAVESIDLDSIRRQFETNVFGLIRMSQLALPGMREPGLGPDRERQLDGRQADLPRRRHLPRDQVRGRGDLRRDALRGRGLRGRRGLCRAGTDRDRLRRRGGRARSTDGAAAEGPYAEFNARGRQGDRRASTRDRMRRLGGGPETVARTIEKAITARRPRSRYKVTPSARLAIAQRRLVSDRMWDRADGYAVPAAQVLSDL